MKTGRWTKVVRNLRRREIAGGELTGRDGTNVSIVAIVIFYLGSRPEIVAF